VQRRSTSCQSLSLSLSLSLTRSRHYSLEWWRGRGAEWVFLNWTLSFKLFYFHPILLCFNKVAPATRYSSTPSLSLCRFLSPSWPECVSHGLWEGTRLTRRTREIPTMQYAQLFTFYIEENVSVSVSFCLFCTSSAIFFPLLREQPGFYLQLMTPLWIQKPVPTSKQPWGASFHVWRPTYLISQENVTAYEQVAIPGTNNWHVT
jgi:hypothetical protein